MKLSARVSELLRKGGRLSVDAGALRYHFARGALTEADLSFLRCSRDAIVDFLQALAPRAVGLVLQSPAQQRLWSNARTQGPSNANNLTCGLRLRGQLDQEALIAALDRLVARHETLRTTLTEVDEVALQVISAAETDFQLTVHNLEGAWAADRELQAMGQLEATCPFDLEQGPLARGRLIKLAADDHALLLTMHRIISDGWSCGVVLCELGLLYGAFHDGLKDPLPPLRLQYTDHVLRQRARPAARGEATSQTPVTGHEHRSDSDQASSSIPIVLDAALTFRLIDLSCRHQTTLYMTLLAVWGALISRLTAQGAVVVSTVAANRTRAGTRGLVGCFADTRELQINLSGEPTGAQLLSQVKEQVLQALRCQDTLFDPIEEQAQPFQTAFVWQGESRHTVEFKGLQLELFFPRADRERFDLTLALGRRGRRLVGTLSYLNALFQPDMVRRYADYFRRLLEGVVADDTVPVERVRLLDECESRRLIETWNSTRVSYPRNVFVHDLISQRTLLTAADTALIFEGSKLSYAAIDQASNQLAHHLRSLGVGPEKVVGLCLERSPQLVTGLLGIFKAGGAYMPLDPRSPAHRLDYILCNSGTSVLITSARLAEEIFAPALASGTHVVRIDADEPTWGALPQTMLHTELQPDNLAYVIYTSESSGPAKGVMVSHSALMNRLFWMQEAHELTRSDRVLQKAPCTLDVSLWELLWPLMTGATLVMARSGGHADAPYLCDLIRRESITALHFTPSALQEFVAVAAVERCTSIRMVFCSGEPLPDALRSAFFECFAAELHNLYGPEEAAMDATFWPCSRHAAPGNVPIGRPIANTRVYVLDQQLEPVPIGVQAELFVSGAGVPRGYLGLSELTEERFLLDPFFCGERMFRTGDLGRWRADGTLEYLGRAAARTGAPRNCAQPG